MNWIKPKPVGIVHKPGPNYIRHNFKETEFYISSKFSLQSYEARVKNKNIERYTAHTIISCPIPEQWQMDDTSDGMMTIR